MEIVVSHIIVNWCLVTGNGVFDSNIVNTLQ
jgi:hypothetical protein